MNVVFDLDGTLADGSHRLHYLNGSTKDWEGFYRAVFDDVPIRETIDVCNNLWQTDNHVEIWTHRPESIKAETKEWLEKHNVNYYRLRMREDSDDRDAVTLKEEWYKFTPPEYKPNVVFEDRPANIEMFRKHGVRVYQVAPDIFGIQHGGVVKGARN